MPLVRDADGQTIPYDDDTLTADDFLLRRIDPDHHLVSTDAGYRVTSAAFSESSPNASKYGGMSVQVERLAADPLAQLPPDWGLVKVRVGTLRAKNYLVGVDPVDGDDSHTCVWAAPLGKPGKKIPIKEADYHWVVLPTKMRA